MVACGRPRLVRCSSMCYDMAAMVGSSPERFWMGVMARGLPIRA